MGNIEPGKWANLIILNNYSLRISKIIWLVLSVQEVLTHTYCYVKRVKTSWTYSNVSEFMSVVWSCFCRSSNCSQKKPYIYPYSNIGVGIPTNCRGSDPGFGHIRIQGSVPRGMILKILKNEYCRSITLKAFFFVSIFLVHFKYHPSFEVQSPGSEFSKNHNSHTTLIHVYFFRP